ncbi:hypothetical protein P171DRAFT_517990 [Karstenula rhodostoma CBS 690.94]|uniref:2EXR domain-containing protein n=1 Tax=Karstenula rhodostoma CBS 690.94 TaxID=1392251 RepID=A0A9P4UGF1_9PLEO|nr:hypothetical protein P171DRAFT_517990 [Karstenula rhodostoma CBS 690.94]
MATFHQFPRLPFELRARIWALTVEPRTVEVSFWPLIGDCWLVSRTPVPAPLQACRDSRRELQGQYEQAFADLDTLPLLERRYIWVNFDMDLIDIGKWEFYIFRPVKKAIQRLKFEREHTEDFCRLELDDLRKFTNLREIHVVCTEGLFGWSGALEGGYWPCDAEKVRLIDCDGTVMKPSKVDEMVISKYREISAQEGYDYDSGLPLGCDEDYIECDDVHII